MSTSPETDIIERLREERPDELNDPSLSSSRMPRFVAPAVTRKDASGRRRARRTAIVIACTAAVVLAGVQLVASNDSAGPRVRGISTAQAAQLAVSALRGVSKLTDYHMVRTWSATEVGGQHRVVSTRTDATVTDGNRASFNTNRNDFVDLNAKGAEFRTVGGRTYVESNTPRIKQRWVVALVQGGGSIGSYSEPPPQTAGIIAQLQRERLITARRTTSGSVVVEVRRTAGELADIDGMSIRMSDPITAFATGIARSGDPDTMVTARVTISAHGNLRGIRISAQGPTTLPDGHGGAKVTADTVNEWKLGPATAKVTAPDPHDVMVVGDLLQTRHGATGLAGPQGALDTFTPASLRALKKTMQANPKAISAYYTQRPGRPARDYSKLMKSIAHKRNLMRAELARMDRSPDALAANERCTPYWPASGRAMDPARAHANPATAGWRCHLTTVDAYVSSEPGQRGWMWEFIGGGGGGCCLTPKMLAPR